MRYFQVHQVYIDSELPQLHCDGESTDIEPKLHQLLLFFCRNPNVVISRDQIINEVNQGVIVSDNAVNKMVANLRQLLGDNPRQPQFIKTIPRQGYSFIAPVTLCDAPVDAQSKSDSNTSNITPKAFTLPMLVGLMAMTVAILFSYQGSNEHEIKPNGQLIPLTRHSGVEFAPSVSPDGNYLSYTRNDPTNNIQQLWLMPLNHSKPEKLLADQTHSGVAAWTSDSNKLVYTDYTDGRCQFVMVTLSETPFPKETLAECKANYVRQLMVYDDSHLLYAAYEEPASPAKLFKLSLKDKTRTLINQPTPQASGNYGFDLSADKSKLLIISADESYKTTLYQLNTTNNELTLLSQWPRMLAHAIWHHDNKSIVHTSNRYSHELVVSTIEGEKLATLASTSNRVAENFSRHPNGKDFYFTSFMMNNDNVVIDMNDNSPVANFNSSVYDKIPSFGKTKDQWYFVSKRVGISQIFAANEQTLTTEQLTHFTEEPDVEGLDVSVDGHTLLLKGQNSITLFNLLENNFKEVAIDSQGITATNFLDNDTIAITAMVASQPRLIIYDKQQKLFDARWKAAFASPSGKRHFYVESNTLSIYEHDRQSNTFSDTGISLPYTFGSSSLNVAANEESIIYGEHKDSYTELISVNLTTGERKSHGKWLFMAGFNVLGDHIVLSYEHSRSGDIVTTKFD